MLPKLLDLFCGVGGAAHGYQLAGFDVTGVDNVKRPKYIGKFIHGDAIEILQNKWQDYDAIHASPPCQTWSMMTTRNRSDANWEDSYPDCLTPLRKIIEECGINKPIIIENVQNSPVNQDLKLCGLMFDLPLFRHRIFEFKNWKCTTLNHPSHVGHRVSGWRHGKVYEGDIVSVYGRGGYKGTTKQWQDAMEIHWTTNKREIAEAVPPAYTEYIGKDLQRRWKNGRLFGASRGLCEAR